MKKTTLVVLLLFSALAWAGAEPNPAGYTINVHVSSSRLERPRPFKVEGHHRRKKV